MTKKEVLDEIIYGLKMHDTVDFEVDGYESWSGGTLINGGYWFQSQHQYFEVKNLTSARKEITKLGKKLLCL